MTKVKCSVKSCYYWGEDNKCTAETIMVKNTLPTDTDDDLYRISDMEIGSMERNIDPEHIETTKKGTIRDEQKRLAARSSETCCETFKPKDDIKL